jgi:2-polyprenyl-3-methyl-5-hydroxy-6-metoxy-1,4-benzoquinol methylase
MSGGGPSPELFFDTITAYQRTAALKGALELDLFSAIGDGATGGAVADRCGASARGVRMLCDYLTSLGFLVKEGDRYRLTPDSAAFLDRRSPAYAGAALEFLLAPELAEAFRDVAGAVRRGGTVVSPEGSLASGHPIWVAFARGMAGSAGFGARLLAGLVSLAPGRPRRVLDVAAGHGMYGIAFAERHPDAEVVVQDWPNVLEVARENAVAAGVADRVRLLPGSAFDVDFGSGYDVVLLPNFLHHFDPAGCGALLRKVHGALAPGGRAVAVEIVPDEGRVTPPLAARFALVMLCSTPGGDAYTFAELERMFRDAGFSRSERHGLPPTPQAVLVAHR